MGLRKLFSTRKKRPVPDGHSSSDLHLVAYPKSGITWLTFLCAAVNARLSGLDLKPTLFNITSLIPDLHDCRQLGNNPFTRPGQRMIKSHRLCTPDCRSAVYLVRDPRDTLLSYYHYRGGADRYARGLDEFIEHPDYGIDAWVRHVRSWLMDSDPSQRIYVLCYEALKADTRREVRALYGALGWSLDDDCLDDAVGCASLDAMKNDEAFYRSRHPNFDQRSKAPFIRQGKVGGGRQEMSPEACRRIELAAGEIMDRLGYARA